MRTLSAVLLLALATLAGCADPTPRPVVNGEMPGEEPDQNAELNATLQGMQTFCASEEVCDFWDDAFHQYVVYDLDTVVIDVVIVPPVGGSTPDNLVASRMAVQGWADGIAELGAPWLVENFTINIYAVGIDVPSLDAVEDPEIIVISSSAAFIVGIGLEPKQIGCILIDEGVLADHGGHFHGEHYIMAQDCTGTGFTCFALNVGALDPRGLYDLIAHEVGHCLGPGHVGDAGDFRAKYAPVEDIMSYQDNPAQVHCVSNMNVRVIEGVYAHLLDRPEEEFLPRGSYLEHSILDYAQVDCPNPPGV